MNALGDDHSSTEREINAAHARHIAPFEHALPDPGPLLVRETGAAAPLRIRTALTDLAAASTALAGLALRFRALPGRHALPIPLTLSSFPAFLVLALPALSLSRSAPDFTPLSLVSEISLLTLALTGRALILANLALPVFSAFLATLAGRSRLALLAQRAALPLCALLMLDLALRSLLVLHLAHTAAARAATTSALFLFLCARKDRPRNKRDGRGRD